MPPQGIEQWLNLANLGVLGGVFFAILKGWLRLEREVTFRDQLLSAHKQESDERTHELTEQSERLRLENIELRKKIEESVIPAMIRYGETFREVLDLAERNK